VTNSSRHYEVGADVRTRVDPHRWHVETPVAGTTDLLVVAFDRPLDHALLQHCIAVVDDDGNHTVGRARTAIGERSWQFAPAAPWERASYRLIVEPILEDLAGNSLRRVFDRDLSDPQPEPERPVSASVVFSPS
jgi:hypothetical protein